MAERTSVVMPVRDGERFLKAAIGSVLAQLGDGDELIVADDGSQDGTRAILHAMTDSRLRRASSGGRGVSAARNVGMAAAGGAYLAFLDHDDLWAPGRHARLLAHLIENSSLGAVFGRVRIRLEDDASRGHESEHLDGRHIPALVGSGLYRIEAVRGIGGFCEQLHFHEDSDFHYRLAELGVETAMVDTDALIHRRHGGNVTNDRTALSAGLIPLAKRKLERARAYSGDRVSQVRH